MSNPTFNKLKYSCATLGFAFFGFLAAVFPLVIEIIGRDMEVVDNPNKMVLMELFKLNFLMRYLTLSAISKSVCLISIGISVTAALSYLETYLDERIAGRSFGFALHVFGFLCGLGAFIQVMAFSMIQTIGKTDADFSEHSIVYLMCPILIGIFSSILYFATLFFIRHHKNSL